MSPPSLQTLLQFTGVKASLFPANSRYNAVDTETLAAAGGQTIVYLRRRFVPLPSQLSIIQQHTVLQGERLDNLASQFLGDPALYWRLCDANAAMRPEQRDELRDRPLLLVRLYAIMLVATQALRPLLFAFSRSREWAADRFALAATQDAAAGASAFRRLRERERFHQLAIEVE